MHDDARLAEVLHGLRRDGYYRFNSSWGFARVMKQEGSLSLIHSLLDQVAPRPDLGGNMPLKAGALPNDKIANIAGRLRDVLEPVARWYLGSDSAIDGLHAYRLPATRIKVPTTPDSPGFAAAMWHHDRCGARLKAHVLLSEVDEATHPMRIAKGSHRTVYYRYHDMASSRYTDAFVERSYETVTLTGKVGEGFIFDTNALHKATGDAGRAARSVLLFEMNAENKSREMRSWAGAPCPGGKQFLQAMPPRDRATASTSTTWGGDVSG